MLPYKQARAFHFDKLVKEGLIELAQPKKAGKAVDEDSIVAKLMEKMVPALKDIVQTAVEDAVKKALKAKTQEEEEEEKMNEDLYWTPPALHSPVPKSLGQQALERIGGLLKLTMPKWTCDEQRVAMEAVLECQRDVMAIMRTGSGKSMLMIIPSLLEKNKVTVGVLPLKSLLSDYRRKLDEQGVPYEVFHSQRSPKLTGRCNLVLVTIDQARSQHWKQELAELNERIPVARMVMDEGHYAITDSDWRGVLDMVHDLRQFPMQMVVLSATIPPKSEAFTKEAFGLSRNAVVVRMCTSRPELAYMAEKTGLSNQAIVQRVKDLVDEAKLEARERTLVFVPYLDQGEQLAKTLGCSFYHGGKDLTDEERQRIYEDWIAGRHKTMVCTNAFGAGNDYPYVPLVIHAGTPREMIGYTQESSRAGRKQQPSRCVILAGNPLPLPSHPELDRKGRAEMNQMLFGSAKETCIRYLLTEFNDGRGVRCKEESGSQQCSRCQEPATSRKRPVAKAFEAEYLESKRRKIEHEQSKAAYVKEMLEALDEYLTRCTYCMCVGVQAAKHPMLCCPSWLKMQTPQEYMSMRHQIKYGKKHKTAICYMCHVPQVNDLLHGTFSGAGGESCRYPDCIAPLAFGIYFNANLRIKAGQHYKTHWSGMAAFIGWLNEAPVGGECSKITELLLWYYRENGFKTNP